MGTLDDLLAQPPPDELYHYTSQAGLIGILTSGAIWASKITHLNDAAELVLAFDLAREQVELLDASSDFKGDLLDHIDSMKASSINVFVFSLTENGDQLSQWRGYTPLGSGYSIGFLTTVLTAAANRSGRFSLGPCCYDPFLQKKLVSEIVAQALERQHTLGQKAAAGESPSHSLPRSLPFRDALYFAAPFLKHEAFAEEREWRLVSTPIPYGDPSFKHRPGTSHLVPYFELSLRDGRDPLRLGHVIVGPTPHPSLAAAAVVSLASSLGLGGWGVETSEVPFRPW